MLNMGASTISCFMRKSMVMTVLYAILFACCTLLPGFADDLGRSEEILARLWTDKAAALLANPDMDNLAAANDALDAAEEFYPPGPDALYLRARIVLDNRLAQDNNTQSSHIRQAEALALASLDYEPARQFPPKIPFTDRALLYSRLALRLKNYSSLLNYYESWPRGHRDSIQLLYAASRAALYLGLNERAAELALRGESLSSAGDSLSVFGMGLDNPLPAFRAVSVAAGDEKAIETVGSAMKKWGDAMEKTIMLWVKSGTMENRLIQRIRSHLNTENTIIADLVLGRKVSPEVLSTVKNYLPLARQAGIAIENTPGGIIAADYSGTIQSDVNYDGYVEEEILLQNGEIQSRRIDADQDGVDEWSIGYSNGYPAQISLDNDLLIAIYEANAYPEISTLINNNPTESIQGKAEFQSGAFSWDIGKGDPRFGPLDRPTWNDSSLWPYLKSVAIHAVIPETGEIGETTTWFVKGYPVKAVEIRYSELNPDEPLWVREMLFDDGVITAGRRSVRMQGDIRLWEFYERYEKGEFVGLAWAPGVTSYPVYWKDWALEPWLRTQVWNLDADGWMDVRRFVTARAGESASKLFAGEASQDDLLPWNAESWEPWE